MNFVPLEGSWNEWREFSHLNDCHSVGLIPATHTYRMPHDIQSIRASRVGRKGAKYIARGKVRNQGRHHESTKAAVAAAGQCRIAAATTRIRTWLCVR
jgi:hypothetical protein